MPQSARSDKRRNRRETKKDSENIKFGQLDVHVNLTGVAAITSDQAASTFVSACQTSVGSVEDGRHRFRRSPSISGFPGSSRASRCFGTSASRVARQSFGCPGLGAAKGQRGPARSRRRHVHAASQPMGHGNPASFCGSAQASTAAATASCSMTGKT